MAYELLIKAPNASGTMVATNVSTLVAQPVP
jgi:hypothetical protein